MIVIQYASHPVPPKLLTAQRLKSVWACTWSLFASAHFSCMLLILPYRPTTMGLSPTSSPFDALCMKVKCCYLVSPTPFWHFLLTIGLKNMRVHDVGHTSKSMHNCTIMLVKSTSLEKAWKQRRLNSAKCRRKVTCYKPLKHRLSRKKISALGNYPSDS